MGTLEKYPEYKESGVEWIGKIPKHWSLLQSRYIFRTVTRKDRDGTELKLSVTQKNGLVPTDEMIENSTQAASFEDFQTCIPKDLVLNKYKAHLGVFWEATSRGIITNNYTVFKPLTDLPTKYYELLYHTKIYQDLFYISTYGVTEGMMPLYTKDFYSLMSIVPPKKEILQMLSFLDKKNAQIDQAIRQKEKMIELLKERRQIVINEAVTKGLKSDAPMKESGVEWIGEIPEDWKVSKLGVCLKPISIKNRTDLPLLSVAREQGVILRDVEDKESNHNFIPDDLSNYKMVKQGQFAMNKMKAWQGSYGISDYTGIVSPAYYIFELNGIEPSFFHKAIRSKVYVPFFTKASDGVRIGQWDLSKTRMKEIPFYIPSKDEQLLIVKHIEEQTTKIDTAIELQQKYISKLKEYKATLIDSVVTGKVRVA